MDFPAPLSIPATEGIEENTTMYSCSIHQLSQSTEVPFDDSPQAFLSDFTYCQ